MSAEGRRRRASALVALVTVALLGLGGCVRTHLFYDTRELRHEPLDKKHQRALTQELAGRLKGKRVQWVDPDGKERSLSPDAGGLSQLPLPELAALWLATSVGDLGGENDLRVHVSKRRSVPVSVLRDLEGNVRIISARRGHTADDGAAPSLNEIKKRFSLRRKVSGRWSAKERRALAAALSLLSPSELERIREVAFERRSVSPDGDRARSAFFEMEGCRAVIYLYSSGVSADRFRFTGDASRPKSAMLHSLVHEIGHALEQSAANERYCAAEKARGALANRLINEGNSLVKDSPALAAYLRALDGSPAPTDYGDTSAHESFAESFALFHVDPDALARTRPSVYRWFKEGRHLEAFGDR